MNFASLVNKLLFQEAYNDMSPEQRDAYEAELDKKERYKEYLSSHNTPPSWTLEQAYEGVRSGKVSFEQFEDWIGNL